MAIVDNGEERALRPRLAEAMAGENAAVVDSRVREWSRENLIERVLLRQAPRRDREPISPTPPIGAHWSIDFRSLRWSWPGVVRSKLNRQRDLK
jgi:hypothetical protein